MHKQDLNNACTFILKLCKINIYIYVEKIDL